MKIALLLVVAIAALAYAEAVVVSNSQREVNADVSPGAAIDGDKLNRRQKRSLKNVVGNLVDKAAGVKNDIGKKAKSIKNSVGEKVTGIIDGVDKKVDEVEKSLKDLPDFFNPWKSVQNYLINIINDVLEKLYSEYEGAPIDLKTIKENIQASLDKTIKNVEDSLNNEESTQSVLIQGIIDEVLGNIKKTVKAIIDGITIPTPTVKDSTESSD